MEQPVQVDVTPQGTVRIVLTGAVILVRQEEVLTLVERAMKTEPVTRMSVDLNAVTALDSSGIALLLLLRRRALRAGVAFQLHGARPEIWQHLNLTGLTRLFGLPSPAGVTTAPPPGRADGQAATEVRILDEPFEMADIRGVRLRLSSYGASAGMSEMDQYQLMLAATEVMANSVRHGGGRGHIRVTRRGGHLIIEVTDHGPGIPRRYLAERPRPRPGRIGMAGLWLVHQLCERVDIDTGPHGTTVRLTIALPR